MGLGLFDYLVIAAVAGSAAPFQVHFSAEKRLVDEETLVELFRLDRRRRSRSPLALARGRLEGPAELLHDAFIGVADNTAALNGSCRVSIDDQQNHRDCDQKDFFHVPPLYCLLKKEYPNLRLSSII